MNRTISLAAIVAAALAFPAIAQVTTPPAPMTPPAAAAPTVPSVTVPKTIGATMTSPEALRWVGKPVYSSDNKDLGKVVLIVRGTDNAINELDADIGGFLGLGVSHVKIMPSQFKLEADRVVLSLTAEQAKTLPAVAK